MPTKCGCCCCRCCCEWATGAATRTEDGPACSGGSVIGRGTASWWCGRRPTLPLVGTTPPYGDGEEEEAAPRNPAADTDVALRGVAGEKPAGSGAAEAVVAALGSANKSAAEEASQWRCCSGSGGAAPLKG